MTVVSSTPAHYWLYIEFSVSKKGSFAVRTPRSLKRNVICILEYVKEYHLCDKD